jgi:hypothetical protein
MCSREDTWTLWGLDIFVLGVSSHCFVLFCFNFKMTLTLWAVFSRQIDQLKRKINDISSNGHPKRRNLTDRVLPLKINTKKS